MIVRAVSASFSRALASVAPDPPIDVARARAEHAAYVAALARAGADVVALPPEDDLPDACFVEDCAVVAGGLALVPRLGAPSQRAETAAVRDAIAQWLPVADMDEPATLDGGDCLRLGARLYVGRSARTNAAGAARARAVFAPLGVEVVEVEVRDALHLKSVCSPLADDVVVVQAGTLPAGVFGDARVIEVPEAPAANIVVVGSCALVAAGFASAARAAAEAGLAPIAVDNTELRKADSALTCLSIVLPV